MVQDSSQDNVTQLPGLTEGVEMTKAEYHEILGVHILHLNCDHDAGICRTVQIDIEDGNITFGFHLYDSHMAEIDLSFDEMEEFFNFFTKTLKPNPPIEFPEVG